MLILTFFAYPELTLKLLTDALLIQAYTNPADFPAHSPVQRAHFTSERAHSISGHAHSFSEHAHYSADVNI